MLGLGLVKCSILNISEASQMTLADLYGLRHVLAVYMAAKQDGRSFEFFTELQNTLDREIEAREAENECERQSRS